MIPPYLILHLGLPKTATTFMQNSLFKKSDGVNYIGRNKANNFFERHAGVGLRKAFSLSPRFWRDCGRDAWDKLIRNKGVEMPLIISDENYSVNANFFSFVNSLQSPDPCHIASHLSELNKLACDYGFSGLKVVISIRRQDTWLASRYVQSVSKFESPSKDDFLQRVEKILFEPVWKHSKGVWLDYKYVGEVFSKVLSAENVHFLPMENLANEPLDFVKSVDEVFGANGNFLKLASAPDFFEIKSSNSTGDMSWSFPLNQGQIGTISLEKNDSALILSEFSRCNRELDQEYGLDLARFQYFNYEIEGQV